jgi:hypothetical protein
MKLTHIKSIDILRLDPDLNQGAVARLIFFAQWHEEKETAVIEFNQKRLRCLSLHVAVGFGFPTRRDASISLLVRVSSNALPMVCAMTNTCALSA